MKICNILLIGLIFSLIFTSGCTGGSSLNDQKFLDNVEIVGNKILHAFNCLIERNNDCAKREVIESRIKLVEVTPDDKNLLLARSDFITAVDYFENAIDHIENQEYDQVKSDLDFAVQYIKEGNDHMDECPFGRHLLLDPRSDELKISKFLF